MSDGVVRSLKSAIISPPDNESIIEKEKIVKSFMENENVSEDELNDEISTYVLGIKNGGLFYTSLTE
ncbi:MAG: hypothetical protein J6U02_02550 [Elusimicrobia bacterium]|nr:hypothetical protein [Elusimicrobiota bacterium]